MTEEYTDEERRILEFLRESVEKGERYFRSKNIANHLGLSSKQVGVRLPELAEKTDRGRRHREVESLEVDDVARRAGVTGGFLLADKKRRV